MEPIYRVLTWHKQDVMATVEGLVQINLDSKLPLTIRLFRLHLPTDKVEFETLIAKCLSIPVEFNSFKLLPDLTISCQFSFFFQTQNFTLVSFQQLKPYDIVLLQKKLTPLKFNYTIPQTHLSFDVLNTRYNFIFNASYNQYVTDHGGQSYSKFLSNWPPLNVGASGSVPALIVQQPSQAISLATRSLLGHTILDSHPQTTTEFIPHQAIQPPFLPTTPQNQRTDNLTTPSRPISNTVNRADLIAALRSRLAITNIELLKSAIELNKETSDIALKLTGKTES